MTSEKTGNHQKGERAEIERSQHDTGEGSKTIGRTQLFDSEVTNSPAPNFSFTLQSLKCAGWKQGKVVLQGGLNANVRFSEVTGVYTTYQLLEHWGKLGRLAH